MEQTLIQKGVENDDDQDGEKSDIGGYECARPDRPEPRGGGRRRDKPLLQYSIKNWIEELKG